ncbi:unnamed protein product [Brassica rapa subsp. narinosa]
MALAAIQQHGHHNGFSGYRSRKGWIEKLGAAIMASSTSKICFANISATEFLSWGIQLKEITSKEEASEITSDRIPYNLSVRSLQRRYRLFLARCCEHCFKGTSEVFSEVSLL